MSIVVESSHRSMALLFGFAANRNHHHFRSSRVALLAKVVENARGRNGDTTLQGLFGGHIIESIIA